MKEKMNVTQLKYLLAVLETIATAVPDTTPVVFGLGYTYDSIDNDNAARAHLAFSSGALSNLTFSGVALKLDPADGKLYVRLCFDADYETPKNSPTWKDYIGNEAKRLGFITK